MLVLHTTKRVRKRWKLKPHGPDTLLALLPLRHWQVDTFPYRAFALEVRE